MLVRLYSFNVNFIINAIIFSVKCRNLKCYVLTGEPGLLVGKIKKTTQSSFSGYVEKSASEKKIIRDVFHKGDEVFNSGNILINYFVL